MVAAAGCAHVATASGLAYELLRAAVEKSPAGNVAASTTARLVEVALRFHTFCDTVLGDGRIDALLDAATAMADPGDPVVATRLAIAAAWRAGQASMTADRTMAADAVAAAVAGWERVGSRWEPQPVLEGADVRDHMPRTAAPGCRRHARPRSDPPLSVPQRVGDTATPRNPRAASPTAKHDRASGQAR